MPKRQQPAGFRDYGTLDYWGKGEVLVVPAAPGTYTYSIGYTEDVWLSGGVWEAGPGFTPFADRIHFDVVDVDGILYPVGTVLKRFAEDLWVGPSGRGKIVSEDGAMLPVGLYFHVTVVTTLAVAYKLGVRFHLRRDAA